MLTCGCKPYLIGRLAKSLGLLSQGGPCDGLVFDTAPPATLEGALSFLRSQKRNVSFSRTFPSVQDGACITQKYWPGITPTENALTAPPQQQVVTYGGRRIVTAIASQIAQSTAQPMNTPLKPADRQHNPLNRTEYKPSQIRIKLSCP